jgi:hypothetical protein
VVHTGVFFLFKSSAALVLLFDWGLSDWGFSDWGFSDWGFSDWGLLGNMNILLKVG